MNGFFHRLFDRFHHDARDDYDMIGIVPLISPSDTDSWDDVCDRILSRISNSYTMSGDDVPCELHVFNVPHVDTSHLPSFVVVDEIRGTISGPRFEATGGFDKHGVNGGHFPYFYIEGDTGIERLTRARTNACRKIIGSVPIDKAIFNLEEHFGSDRHLRDRDVEVAHVGDGHGNAWDEFVAILKEARIRLYLYMLPISEEQPESVDRTQGNTEDGKNRDYDFHSRIHNGSCHEDSRPSGPDVSGHTGQNF